MRVAASVSLAVTGLLSVLTATGVSQSRYADVLIRDVPHVRQKPDFCGEACVAMYLQKLGQQADQDWVFDQSGLDPLEGRGCYTRDLHAAIKRIGFDPGPTWHRINVADASAQLERQFAALHGDLRRGVPSIVCMRYDEQPRTTEHFRLIVGYDASRDEVLYHEPAVNDAAYRRMSRKLFFSLWPLKYDARQWTVIRMPLAGSRLVRGTTSKQFTDADYAQHVRELKKKLPGEEFHIVLQRPFVVVGDEAEETVRKRSVGTVKWAVDKLKKLYFSDDPDEIIDIWLFRDKESYEKHAEALFGSRPTTPYGYYSSADRALVMNISTGGGTLVHEIVHPFIASNFPECPSWFNEGLASLYEQCGERDGKITGYTNWRLRGLQQAISRDRVPPFRELMSTTTREFYNEDPGSNYGQARYLCYYLQEHDLLVKYYHAFRRNAKADPTGYVTLQQVLDEKDIPAFQKKWEQYVLKLR